MSEIVLALEAFGGGEEIGCVAATITITEQNATKLLDAAESMRNSPLGVIRMVFNNSTPIRWFVESADNDAIADFTQEASGCKIINEHPGDANLSTEASTIHLTLGADVVFFTWRSVTREHEEPVATVKVSDSFLRTIRDTLRGPMYKGSLHGV